jgi:hypothetical protein
MVPQMDELEMPPVFWNAMYGVRIMDIDGWRRDGKDYDEPLTFDDWHSRMLECTVDARNARGLF